MSPVLRIVELEKSFGAATALKRVSFALKPGEFTVLLGPSGSGKSTLFKSVVGLVEPEHGSIELCGRALSQLRGGKRRDALRDVGLIFQDFNLIERLNAVENVLGGRLGHVPTWRVVTRCFSEADRQRALEALDSVGLLSFAYRRSDTLSGGQQQRVAIARVMVQGARVVFADEPVASLDPGTARSVLETLRAMTRRSGAAVLCSLHQLNYATEFADRVLALRHGELVLDATRDELPRHDLAALYGAAA